MEKCTCDFTHIFNCQFYAAVICVDPCFSAPRTNPLNDSIPFTQACSCQCGNFPFMVLYLILDYSSI